MPGSQRIRTSWRIGAIRLCARDVAIPAPSFRGRGAALGRPAQGGRVARALALYRRLAVGLVAAVLFAHCGPLGALGRRLPGAGAHLFGPGPSSGPSGSPRLRLRRLAPWPFLSSLSRLLAFGLACPWGPLRLPSPRQPSALLSVGRPRGFGLLWGAGVFRSRVSWWGCVLPRSPGFGSRPPQSPGEGFCRPVGRLRLLVQPLFLIQ